MMSKEREKVDVPELGEGVSMVSPFDLNESDERNDAGISEIRWLGSFGVPVFGGPLTDTEMSRLHVPAILDSALYGPRRPILSGERRRSSDQEFPLTEQDKEVLDFQRSEAEFWANRDNEPFGNPRIPHDSFEE